MLMKKRAQSITHLILESLNNRAELSFDVNQNQVKGYEGECLFDQYINHSQQTGFIINDLLLSTKHTYYQIDSLLIFNKNIHIYEIKNYTGSYTVKDGTLFAESGHSIQNPVDQVQRKKVYFHNFLLNSGYRYTISTYTAYVNPDFYIYSMPRTDSILFHRQIEKHFQYLPQQSKKKSSIQQNEKLSEYIISKHHANYRPNNIPAYTFHDLKKGVVCQICASFEASNTRSFRTCLSCGFKERINDAIRRSIFEFQVLFPEMKITVENITLWCNNLYTKYRVQRLLRSEFTLHGKGTSSYYK